MKAPRRLHVLVGLLVLALALLAYVLYPELEWRHRMTGMLRDAPYVELYDAKRNLVAKIDDRATILQLWNSMDLWHRQPALPTNHTAVGSLGYPFGLEWEPGVPFHFPITLYDDGQALWGLTPDSRHRFWSKELKAEVERLLLSYKTNKGNIEPDAAPEPPPAAAVQEASETVNLKPESEAPADGGGR